MAVVVPAPVLIEERRRNVRNSAKISDAAYTYAQLDGILEAGGQNIRAFLRMDDTEKVIGRTVVDSADGGTFA